MPSSAALASHPFLSILDCVACRAGAGLVPQGHDGKHYLACPRCEFWYPIRDEVAILLAPEQNPQGMRRVLGQPCPFPIEQHPVRAVDSKVLIYSYYVRMHEFGTAFQVEREPVVVDVGCSTGSLASWLRQEQTYIGFDMSYASLRFARRATGQFFAQADAQRLPVKSGAVSFMTSREVLEHLDDPAAGIRELSRISQRGVIVVPTLDFPFLYDPVNWLLIRRGRRVKLGIYGYGHQQLYDISGWRSLLQQNGFVIRSELPIGTGFALNAFDVVWHSLYSWREFDSLPRRGAPIGLVRATSLVQRALHRLDGPLLTGHALSQAFEVVPGGNQV